jgi:hypothetical protein
MSLRPAPLPPRARALLLLAAALLLPAVPAPAAPPDWAAIADEDTVTVVTTDDGGEVRETTIWLLVLDDVGYIRTSRSTRWGDNVERNPDIALRVGGVDYPLRASFVEDDAERARIVAGFEAKYGSNPVLNWIRGDDPRIMRLAPR